MRILIVLVLLASPLLLFGQNDQTEKQIEDLSMEELMNVTVVTASQTEQKVSDAPATIYVITEEQIHDRGYSYLDELLEDIPEIEIQRKSASEYSNYYTVRGVAGNEKFLIMLDGVRINSVDATPHVVGSNYPLSNIKQVEVMLGPASALYGVNGFSAIINLFTKKGSDIKGVSVSSQVGSFNTSGYSLNAGGEKNGVSFNVAGNLYHSDEPFMPKYYKNDFAWYNDQYSQNGNMRLAPFAPNVIIPTSIQPYQTPTNSYLINGSVNYKDFELGYYRNAESHNSSVGMKPEYNVYEKDAIYKIEQETIYGRHEFESEDGKWTSKSYLAFSAFDVNPDSKFVNTFSSYRDAYKYSYNKAFILREQVGYRLGQNSSLIGGINFQTFSALAKSGDLPFKYNPKVPADLQNFYYLGTNTTDSTGRDLTIYQNFYNIQESNIGLFGQYQSRFAKIIDATLAVRYDNNSRYGSVLNPRVGFVISPSNALKFKIIYSQAYLAPSPYLSYQHYGSFITVDSQGNPTVDPAHTAGLFGPFWHLPNTNLQPERLKTVEFGASFIRNSLAISADVYYNDLTDLISNKLEFNQQFKGVNVQVVETPTNSGNAYTYGFTTKIDLHKQIGSLRLQSYAAYSYSDGKTDSAPLAYSAKNTIKAGVLFKIGKFSIDPRVIYRSASLQGFIKDSDNNPAHNNAFTLVNLFTAYKLTKNIEVNMKVKNLLNARYYNVSYGGDEALAATPQDPFSIYGGVLVKF